jgi:hypothetical protein
MISFVKIGAGNVLIFLRVNVSAVYCVSSNRKALWKLRTRFQILAMDFTIWNLVICSLIESDKA